MCSKSDEIQKAWSLLESGAITKEEYERIKAGLLAKEQESVPEVRRTEPPPTADPTEAFGRKWLLRIAGLFMAAELASLVIHVGLLSYSFEPATVTLGMAASVILGTAAVLTFVLARLVRPRTALLLGGMLTGAVLLLRVMAAIALDPPGLHNVSASSVTHALLYIVAELVIVYLAGWYFGPSRGDGVWDYQPQRVAAVTGVLSIGFFVYGVSRWYAGHTPPIGLLPVALPWIAFCVGCVWLSREIAASNVTQASIRTHLPVATKA